MIHSELCGACGGPLQLGVGLVYLFISGIFKTSNFLIGYASFLTLQTSLGVC